MYGHVPIFQSMMDCMDHSGPTEDTPGDILAVFLCVVVSSDEIA
jgi:hypothetical protein